MRPPHAVLVLIGATLLQAVPGFGAPPADDLLTVALARMDAASATFKGLTADIRKVAHLDAINADTTDVGTITVKRGGRSRDLQMLIDFKQPDAKQVLFAGSKAQMYILKNPGEVQEYDLSKKFRGMLDQYLLLGFGSNSTDLRNAYTVKVGQPASETVAGDKTTKIELAPKSKEMQQQVKKCELWISDASGITVQQKLYTGGGDYNLATYTRIVINPKLPELKLDAPRGVKIAKPLKD